MPDTNTHRAVIYRFTASEGQHYVHYERDIPFERPPAQCSLTRTCGTTTMSSEHTRVNLQQGVMIERTFFPVVNLGAL